VDFDIVNAGTPRLSVGAVNVRSGNFVYFDTTTHTLGPAHVMASGAAPIPLFHGYQTISAASYAHGISVEVRIGSLVDIEKRASDVRYSPKSGHLPA
jgi:hypothetical protein